LTTVKHPGFFRRAFTHVLDRGIYVGLDALLAILSGDPGRFGMLYNDDGIALTLLLASLALYILDQFVFMAVYGVTFSKWMMGYRLRRKDGRSPGFARAFFWNLIVEPLEILTLGIVSLVLTIKREDRATLHDLVLGTRGVVLDGRHRRKRIIICVIAITLLFCAFINIVSFSLYMIFVNPIKDALIQDGRQLRPSAGSFDTRQYAKPLLFKGLVLFDSSLMSDVDVCLDDSDVNSDKYQITINSSKKLSLANFKYDNFTTALSPGLNFASVLWRLYPFRENPAKTARDALFSDQPVFNLWSPARNLSRVYAHMVWAIMVPSFGNAYEGFSTSDSFFVTYAWENPSDPEKPGLGISFIVITDEGIEGYILMDREAGESDEEWRSYLGKALKEFRPLPPGAERVEDFGQCDPDDG